MSETIRIICELLDVDQAEVIGESRKVEPVQAREIISMVLYLHGWTDQLIADALNCERSTVTKLRTRGGWHLEFEPVFRMRYELVNDVILSQAKPVNERGI
jgi:uncharacterized protein YjcR